MLSIIQKANSFPSSKSALVVDSKKSKGKLECGDNVFSLEAPYHLKCVDEEPSPNSYFVCGFVKSDIISHFDHAKEVFHVDYERRKIQFHPKLTSEQEITDKLTELTLKWKNNNVHPFLNKWRDELYPVFDPCGQIAFRIERVACGLLGVRQYGCHLNGFVQNKQDNLLKMWVARRSFSKQTYPGMLDNIVGGGLSDGLSPIQVMKKEAIEEAGLSEQHMNNLKPVSAISFFADIPERGLVPDTEFIFDIQLPDDFQPKPCDGEVDCFYLMDIKEVIERLNANEFMPESALVVIDFLIRHGFITAENEPNYVDILMSLRRHIPFPSAKF